MRYRFTRTALPMPGKGTAAREFAAKISNYLNDTFGMTVEFGGQLFGDGAIVWTADYPTLAAYEQDFAKIMVDAKYWELTEEAEGIFVEGSLRDTLIAIM